MTIINSSSDQDISNQDSSSQSIVIPDFEEKSPLKHKPFADSSFLIAGVVRNVEKCLTKDVERISTAFDGVTSLKWLIIESDSIDSTIKILSELQVKVSGFRFLSLGELKNEIPLRTERIAFCRNKYVDELRHNNEYSDVDYVVVADLDGMNTLITKSGVLSCWERDDWDVCTANQAGPYYDIWALRHGKWVPNDCWEQLEFFSRYRADAERNAYSSIYSKMIVIPKDSDWIDVDSAFGGLAIYRKKAFDESTYVGLSDNGNRICEHVQFHEVLRQKGFRIAINPKMINAAYTEHTAPLFFADRIKRRIYQYLQKLGGLLKSVTITIVMILR